MLIYTRYVIYRGIKIPLHKLKPNSHKKITIICPECGRSFKRYFKVLRKSGCFLCQKCAIKDKLSTTLEIGMQKNRLTVVRKSQKAGYSIFKCDCGNEKEILNRSFLSGKTRSCGCLKRENMKKIAVHFMGAQHGNWRGGITGERQNRMAKADYEKWRISVYERDGYICQKCGQRGGKLNAHHIFNYANNKDKIIDLTNGCTLCQECHALFHKIYGRNNNTQAQLDAFLNCAKESPNAKNIQLPKGYRFCT